MAAPGEAQLAKPGTAPAKGPDAPTAEQRSDTGVADPKGNAPIVPDAEFNQALPPLSNDINAPLEPMASETAPVTPATDVTPATTASGAVLPPTGPEDPQLVVPLPALASYDTAPLATAADIKDKDAPEIRYDAEIKGLADAGDGLEARYKALSALKGGGKAANTTQVSARAKEDEALVVRLLKSLGYYDATAVSTIETVPEKPGRLKAIVSAQPGRLYTLGSIDVKTAQTIPPDLVRSQLPLKVGDPIQADRIQGAEANVSLMLPQMGYPFVKVGERDILLDDEAQVPTGAYTLPVDTGPRASFGQLRTEGDAVFDIEHLNVFPRFEAGQLYDNRMTDDLRDALVATSLFQSVSVVPQRTGRTNPDGTEQVDLLVRQEKGPARTLGGNVGFSTGQGFRAEGTWQHRNLFPYEGGLLASVIAGTQEQGLAGTFRRANAGRRDRTFSLTAGANHSNYDAYEAFTTSVGIRWSYDSTPIWQKPITYYYGGELVGTNESVYDFAQGRNVRRTYGIVALPGQLLFDRSDSLLNPTKGFRLRLNASPETSVQGSVKPYVRAMVEGTFYYPVSSSIVIAGRAKAGTIQGVARDDLAPSRRYYGGGGGSVRGYGYQRLGPFDPNGDPVGGRSLNEFALEARYRFGDFGIVPFIDAGNSYESSTPNLSSLRYGAGIGGRFYTSFGPMRIDVATPLNPREGDGKVALYISIGQAF
ncbi:BamA/TamA family outer membrane protein [Sphingomonas sp. CFBP9019]|uniref:BamA/TamA family outer membrane protein n=2 Tax=unclassified Sphingomonas TaxID=196159 RepID=UPI002A69A04C|nr:BamA/TamA family outer membrane protein [Sphingomonas sp. CFBP9019]MDY1008053.1 BamA/TamA family outer membrane protein [Sphingomonas sp. CFBP9019]